MPTVHNPRIIESKYPPEDTNVLWIDLSEDEEKKIKSVKEFVNGKWTEKLNIIKPTDNHALFKQFLLDSGFEKLDNDIFINLETTHDYVELDCFVIFFNFPSGKFEDDGYKYDQLLIEFGTYFKNTNLPEGYPVLEDINEDSFLFVSPLQNPVKQNRPLESPTMINAYPGSSFSLNITNMSEASQLYFYIKGDVTSGTYYYSTVDWIFYTGARYNSKCVTTIRLLKEENFDNWSDKDIEIYGIRKK